MSLYIENRDASGREWWASYIEGKFKSEYGINLIDKSPNFRSNSGKFESIFQRYDGKFVDLKEAIKIVCCICGSDDFSKDFIYRMLRRGKIRWHITRDAPAHPNPTLSGSVALSSAKGYFWSVCWPFKGRASLEGSAEGKDWTEWLLNGGIAFDLFDCIRLSIEIAEQKNIEEISCIRERYPDYFDVSVCIGDLMHLSNDHSEGYNFGWRDIVSSIRYGADDQVYVGEAAFNQLSEILKKGEIACWKASIDKAEVEYLSKFDIYGSQYIPGQRSGGLLGPDNFVDFVLVKKTDWKKFLRAKLPVDYDPNSMIEQSCNESTTGSSSAVTEAPVAPTRGRPKGRKRDYAELARRIIALQQERKIAHRTEAIRIFVSENNMKINSYDSFERMILAEIVKIMGHARK